MASRGFKANLKVSFNDLAMNIPVRYEKITSKDIQEQIKVVSRAEDNESVVKKFRYMDKENPMLDRTNEIEEQVSRSKVLIGETNGQIYTKDEITDYQIVEGETTIDEIPVSAPTETTKDFVVNDTRPLDSWDSYLPESEYELYVEKEEHSSFKRLADYMVANDMALMFDFQRANTHKPMKGLVKPVFEQDGFVMMMKFTMTKYSFKHKLDLTPVQKEVKTHKVNVQLNI